MTIFWNTLYNRLVASSFFMRYQNKRIHLPSASDGPGANNMCTVAKGHNGADCMGKCRNTLWLKALLGFLSVN